MPVSQQDIASKLDVSRATVSRSLSNAGGIDPATRRRVVAAAREMGYARSTRGRKPVSVSATRRLTVLVANPGGEFGHGPFADVGAGFLTGISDAATEARLVLDVRYVTPGIDQAALRSDPYADALADANCVGAVLIYGFSATAAAAVREFGPCVSIVNRYSDVGIDCIDANQMQAMGLLVDHLISLGHRRIGFLAPPPTRPTSTWRAARLGGFIQAMAQADMPVDHELLYGMDANTDRGLAGHLERIVHGARQGVTGWVCATDRLAYELIAMLRNTSLRVPADLSIVGFDGLEKPIGMPQLTTVCPPHRAMGVAAVKRLLDRIDQPDAPVRYNLLDCTMVVGETSGHATGNAAGDPSAKPRSSHAALTTTASDSPLL